MARYEELQKALEDRQAWAEQVWPKREKQTIAVIPLVRGLQEAVADELGLTDENRWRNVYQSSGGDLDDDEPDASGHAVYSTLTDHRVCLNVKVVMSNDLKHSPPRAHVVCALLIIREKNDGRYRVAVEGLDATFAEVDVDPNEPATFVPFAKAFTRALLEYYASRPDSKVDGAARTRLGFLPH